MPAKPFAQLTQPEIEMSIAEVEPTAAQAYEAYAVSSGGLNFKGDPMPTWLELPDPIRGHWRAAVTAVIDSL